MIKQLQQWLDLKAPETSNLSIDQVQLACAALMVEVMMIDRKHDPREINSLREQLKQRFGLSTEAVNELYEEAKNEVTDATSLYQFTRAINNHFSDSEKFKLVENLWRVAYADNLLDKHEEAMIRRITELIHLPHSQFMRAKKHAKSC